MKKKTRFIENFIDKIFRLIYSFWNKASLKKLGKSNGEDFDLKGFKELNFLESDKKKLDDQLEKIYKNAEASVNFYNGKSAHNLSNVGNMPLSLESLATKEEINNLSEITQSILRSNPEIVEYLGLEIPQLSLELTSYSILPKFPCGRSNDILIPSFDNLLHIAKVPPWSVPISIKFLTFNDLKNLAAPNISG